MKTTVDDVVKIIDAYCDSLCWECGTAETEIKKLIAHEKHGALVRLLSLILHKEAEGNPALEKELKEMDDKFNENL